MNVAKEVCYQESVEDTTDLSDLDESEETLSLCDLPIYNDDTTTEWNDFSKEAAQTSSEEDQDLFEFFSCEDFTASTCPAKNIIFCGKLIPYKQPPVSEEKPQKLNQNDTEQQQHPKKRGLFQWTKTTSLNKSRTSKSDQCTNNKSNNQSKLQQVSSSKSLALPAEEKSPAKARWHLLLFGLMKLPTEMELSDIKNRQHRRTPSTLIGSFAAAAAAEEVTVGKSSSRGKGFWRVLSSSLKCRNQTANAFVKASFGCIPRV